MVRTGIAVMVGALATGTLFAGSPQRTPERVVQTEVEAAIRAVHAQMREAAERLDAKALYGYVLDGETPPITENGQLAETWSAALARTTQGFQAVTSLSYTYDRESITVLSPTTALWVGAGTATAVLTDGRRIDAPFAESMVFVQRDGQWKILHAHRSTPNR